ncbi:MAG: septum formation protein Maf [Chitinophagaceae bacterium]|nr:septum formation protein Maf [Chitinophagaceae bacterium]
MSKSNLILASASPRRKQLLEMAEVDFEIITQDTDECYPPGLTMEETAIYIATQKGRAVQKKYSNRKILAADTIVVLDNSIIGKPTGRQDAIEILSRLSGKTHQVITGVVILEQKKMTSFADKTLVTFYEITPVQIEHYVDRYQPFDKAGAYAIQEWIGAVAIKNIEGCFYNVMGLPVSRVIPFL